MKVYVAALSLVSLFSYAGDYQTAAGLGHQFGGLLGAQFSYTTDSTKYYGAIGFIGAAVGVQTTFSEGSKHTYGVVLGREELQSEDGFVFATYDYHFNGLANDGLVIGTGFGITREDSGGLFTDTGNVESSTSLTLNIGYKF
jgi:hypothetical protein